MKNSQPGRLRVLLILFLFSATAFVSFSQIPDKMSYQAVVRDASGNLVSEQDVSVLVSILTPVGGLLQTEYSETFQTQTNANGLITLEIGEGKLNSLDWDLRTYFLDIKIDPKGGTNYTIHSQSQILTVPMASYAHESGHAAKADSLTTDLYHAGAGIAIENDTIKVSDTYKVGDYAFGGVVFYVDKTGQHGMVCSLHNTKKVKWASSAVETNTRCSSFNGLTNTMIIMACTSDDDNTAAYACLTGGGFLPSFDELKILRDVLDIIEPVILDHGGDAFIDDYYWSSCQITSDVNILNLKSWASGMEPPTKEHYCRPISYF
jgi:hypothetical protein